VQQILSAIPEMRSIFAERVSQGFYLNVEVNRAEAARYGLTIADAQQAVTSGIGGEMVAENVEGRERYPVNVRYGRDFRDNVEELRRVLIGTPSGAQIPVSDVANIYALTGGLILQKLLGYNFSVAVWVGYIALFGIAVETGVVMVVYLHEALDHRLNSGVPLRHEDIEAAIIEGAVHRLRPKLMTVCVVLASLIPILWESGVGSDVMKPIAAPIAGGMITSTIHVLILVPVFFALMKERALRRGTLQPREPQAGA